MKSISAETKKLLIFAFLLHLQTCLLTLICAQKQGFHMDEYFTFGLALCGVPLPDSCKILHASPKDFLSGTVFLQCAGALTHYYVIVYMFFMGDFWERLKVFTGFANTQLFTGCFWGLILLFLFALLQQRKRKNPFFCPRNCPLIRAALLL